MTESSSRPPTHAGCRVTVFFPDAVSGATLGYHGTLVGREEPGWYWVFVPSLGRRLLVRHSALLVFQHTDEGDRLVEPDDSDVRRLANLEWEIEFESPPEADNAVLRGKYRVGSVEKGRFEFVKLNQTVPSYFFRMPAEKLGSSRGRIKCKVPAHQVLDRAYVMKTLASVLARALPAEGEAATA
jgi:hypothetical protein